MCNAALTPLLLGEIKFKICFRPNFQGENKVWKCALTGKKKDKFTLKVSNYFVPLFFGTPLVLKTLFVNDRIRSVILLTVFYSPHFLHQKVNGFFLESNEQQLYLPVPSSHSSNWESASAVALHRGQFSISLSWYEYVIRVRSSRVHQHMYETGI